jgi:hypothetical protein
MKIPNAALAYREATSLGASPVGVVVLLYDRLAQDIHAAVAAMRSNQVETRGLSINHCCWRRRRPLRKFARAGLKWNAIHRRLGRPLCLVRRMRVRLL